MIDVRFRSTDYAERRTTFAAGRKPQLKGE